MSEQANTEEQATPVTVPVIDRAVAALHHITDPDRMEIDHAMLTETHAYATDGHIAARLELKMVYQSQTTSAKPWVKTFLHRSILRRIHRRAFSRQAWREEDGAFHWIEDGFHLKARSDMPGPDPDHAVWSTIPDIFSKATKVEPEFTAFFDGELLTRALRVVREFYGLGKSAQNPIEIRFLAQPPAHIYQKRPTLIRAEFEGRVLTLAVMPMEPDTSRMEANRWER